MEQTFSYDRLPYSSKFFVQTGPDRLATTGLIFGMSPAPVETCRVLELACGNGSNLLSQAYLLPNASFIGVDLGKDHIDEANASAGELELKNIEFRQMDVMEMTLADFGKFDYITAHGLFSWVPDVVRDRVLGLYRELLEENGIGYISYGAYPGAYQRQMVRSMLRYHTNQIVDPAKKVDKALDLLRFLGGNTPEKGPYRAVLEQEIERHRRHNVSDVFHDDLADFNNSYYFSEFASMLNNSGLKYLGETEFHGMGSSTLSPDARKFVDAIEDFDEREQYLDFIRGRMFRQSLVCRKEIDLDRGIDNSVVEKLLISSSLTAETADPDIASRTKVKFSGPKKTSIEIDQPLPKAVILRLGSIWPRAVPFSELVEAGKKLLLDAGYEADDWESQIDIVRNIFFQIASASDMVEFRIHQPAAAATALSAKPKLNELARWQMKTSDHILTLLNIDMKIEDKVSRRLLELANGKRTPNAMIDEIGKFIRSSHEIERKKQLLADLPQWISESLNMLARLGVFES